MTMQEPFLLLFLVGWLAATLRVATPLIFGTIGELFCERAGVLNLGIEGIMFFGAFVGFAVAYRADVAGLAGYLWLGLLAAILAGMLMGALMGFFAVTLGVNQHVAGLGITLLCTSLSLFLFRLVFGENEVLPSVDPFAQLAPLGDMAVLGPILQQYLLTYAAFLLITPLAWWLLYRSTLGLEIRAVGENPEAADAAGINVFRTRYVALLLGSGLMAVGGAFLLAGYHRRARLGLYCAGHLCPLGPAAGSDRGADLWRRLCPAAAPANAGL
jgi:simple sugar transport system permease protein